jgi:homoserine kinase type II
MKTVFLVFHVRIKEDLINENVKLLGVFSSHENAEAHVQKVKSKPGFCDHPQGFSIDEHMIDQGSWLEGFGCGF